MAKPWEISRDDIEEWAARSPIEAPEVLPRLVRRLLFATSPLGEIAMRAGGGMRYEGWDGTVRAQVATAFCPAALSVWELSIEKSVRKKLDGDYETRTQRPPEGVRPALAAYVAVTARSFPRKADWIAGRKAERVWRDVRVYDADDLATWLEQAPAVARWFASLQGRPAYEGKDVEAFLDAWRQRTSPPLPAELVLAGEARLTQSDDLLAWIAAPSDRPLLVRGRTREEALVFAAASLAREPGRDERVARALVVETQEAWRWAMGVQRASSLIVLPVFDDADVGQAAAANVRLILPADLKVPEQRGATLTLEAQPWPAMAKALESAAFVADDAERLVRRAGGEVAALQRLCGYVDVDVPDWAKRSPRAELLALLLAGAWAPSSEGDREVIRRLGGDPAVAEQLATDLVPSVMRREIGDFSRDVFRWSSPDVAWDLLGRGLTDGQLDRFREVVMDVLGTADPAYELPKEERFMAAVKGKALPQSDAVREGLAESIVRLSVHDDILAASRGGMHQGAARAEGLVRWLLRPEQGWVIWASLSRLLPFLAEASPKAFLNRVEVSLDRGAEGVAHLFEEEGGMFGHAPHTGLLSALEVLAWHPEDSVRRGVVLALTRLDAAYPEGRAGRVDNRPIRSLGTLLRYAMPRSNTTVDERNDLLRLVFRQSATTGRALALTFVRDLRGAVLMHQGVSPRFHQWAPNQEPSKASGVVAMEDVDAQIRVALELLIADAGTDPKRWAMLGDAVLHGPEYVESHVLAALMAQKELIQDPEGELWAWLRKSLSNILPEQASHPKYVTLNQLYSHFTPTDQIQKYAWLFESLPSLPGLMPDDVHKHARRVDEIRNAALAELWQGPDEERWRVLGRLAQAVRSWDRGVRFLGEALANATFATELEPRILANTAEGPSAALAIGFGAARAKALGLAWLEALLTRFMNNGRVEEAARIADGAVDSKTITYRALWDILERLGEPLESAYWRAVWRIFGHPSNADMRYAVEHFVSVGREDVALQATAFSTPPISGALAFLVLDKYKERTSSDAAAGVAPTMRQDPSVPEYVEQLFRRIDADPPADKDPLKDIALLEIYYLPILAQTARPARYVSQAFGEYPDIFVELIAKPYPREEEVRPEQDVNHKRAAQNAITLLHAWRGYPGEGLPESERDAKLEAWAAEVLQKTRKDGRGHAGSVHVTEVLARVPQGSDGIWPCVAARRLLESGLYPDLASDLSMAKHNLRGATRRALDEGGAQEQAIAERYREASRQIEATYPRTAAMLDALARRYDSEAERHEAQAQRVRIVHGEQPEEEEPPSTPRTAPLHRGPVSRLFTAGVGPAPHFDVPLRPRLNLLIGDNSLGKTFILEVLWWVLTGAWADPDVPAKPQARRGNGRSAPAASIRAEAAGRHLVAEYDPTKERWKRKGTRALAPGLAIYARADGSFSVWDPVRNAKLAEKTEQDLSKGYRLTPRELFHGLVARDGVTKLCRGLVEDTVSWRAERKSAFAALEKVLTRLSLPEEPIKLGLPRRFKIRDAVTHPTLDLGYEASVFVVHASAAVKRILSLAYVLVWAVSEIREAAPLAGHAPLDRVTLLVDEVEAHLHPRWQRVILPALLSVMDALAPTAEVQLVVTTHAPLVLASVETVFDKARDQLLELEQKAGSKGKVVRVVEESWERLGDANTWLMQRFGLKQPRSTEAEEAIEQAAAALEKPKLGKREWKALNERLHAVLSDVDPFWVRWQYIADKRGWLS